MTPNVTRNISSAVIGQASLCLGFVCPFQRAPSGPRKSLRRFSRLMECRVPNQCPPEIADLIMQCRSTDSRVRPTARELLQRLDTLQASGTMISHSHMTVVDNDMFSICICLTEKKILLLGRLQHGLLKAVVMLFLNWNKRCAKKVVMTLGSPSDIH